MRRGAVYNKDEVGKVVSNLLLAADKKLNSTKKRPAKSAIVVNIGGTGFTSSILKKSLPLYGQPVTTRTLTAIEKMAQESCRLLLEHIADGNKMIEEIVLRGETVIREST